MAATAQATAGAVPPPAQTDTVPVRRVVAFFAMVFGMFMSILDIQIVSASLAEIQAGLGAGADEIAWAVAARDERVEAIAHADTLIRADERDGGRTRRRCRCPGQDFLGHAELEVLRAGAVVVIELIAGARRHRVLRHASTVGLAARLQRLCRLLRRIARDRRARTARLSGERMETRSAARVGSARRCREQILLLGDHRQRERQASSFGVVDRSTRGRRSAGAR